MKKIILGAMLIAGTFVANAQKVKVVEGDLSAVKGQSSFNIEFDYSDMAVGKFKKESDYIEKRRKEINEKEAGKGDSWADSWVSDRESRFEPKFLELINKYSTADFKKENESVKYTMIVHTVFTEPGFNIAIMKKPSDLRLEIRFVETDNREKVLCKLVTTGNIGQTFGYGDFDTGTRIAESYAKGGKGLGRYLAKKWKK